MSPVVRKAGSTAAVLLALSILCSPTGRARAAGTIDYRDPANWAALPAVWNNSMRVPSADLRNAQATAEADVFYVYPTVYASLFGKNASVKSRKYRRKVAERLLTSQASSLNDVGRIYAPYYRQASLWVYLGSKKARRQAFDTAYADVAASFRYYMAHHNRGRPLIVLAHSQGSQIAVRLLREYYEKLHLDRILVVAYLIGERIGTRTFAGLVPCTSPTQTDCFVTWGTVLRGGKPTLMTGRVDGEPVCINPLSWRMNTEPVSRAHHLGGVPDTFDRILPHLVAARCRNGVLEIAPAPPGFAHAGKDYHESDINLFYMDIRRNARMRLRQYRHRHAPSLPTRRLPQADGWRGRASSSQPLDTDQQQHGKRHHDDRHIEGQKQGKPHDGSRPPPAGKPLRRNERIGRTGKKQDSAGPLGPARHGPRDHQAGGKEEEGVDVQREDQMVEVATGGKQAAQQ